MNDSAHQHSAAVQQVEREHEELRDAIKSIHTTLADPDSASTLLAEQLASCCEKLESHFRTEEDGGFFAEITNSAPRLSDQADKLCHEHETMLNEAKTVRDQTRRLADSEGDRKGISAAFHAFSKQLMHHESEENDMLQKAYWEDIGPAD